MLDKIVKSLHEIFSEPGPDGTLSWGRIGSSLALLASVYWICAVLITNHPHSLAGIDFRSIAEYVTAPYAANKISTALQSFSKHDQ